MTMKSNMNRTITYVTGNQAKFLTAQKYFEPLGTDLVQKQLNMVEIQSDKVEDISLDKAQKAFEALKVPLIVNDASWIIESLGGFPGPYTHYINGWFTPQDWQVLLARYANKPIILRQAVVYIDDKGSKILTHDAIGKILTTPRGNDKWTGFDQIVSMAPSGESLAEVHEKQGYSIDGELPLWEKLSQYLESQMEVK
jgi:XTP/dITP diphosphohydrolase